MQHGSRTRGLDTTDLSAPIVVDHARLAESDEPGTTTEAGLIPRWSLNLSVHRHWSNIHQLYSLKYSGVCASMTSLSRGGINETKIRGACFNVLLGAAELSSLFVDNLVDRSLRDACRNLRHRDFLEKTKRTIGVFERTPRARFGYSHLQDRSEMFLCGRVVDLECCSRNSMR